MNNKILDTINEEIARVDRALEMINASKGKNPLDEQNRARARNLLTITKQNLEDVARSLSKPRIMKNMATSATNSPKAKSATTKLGK